MINNDVAFRNKLKAEEEIDEIFRKQEAELKEAKEIATVALRQKQEAEKQTEIERQQKQEMQLNIAKNLLLKGLLVNEVATITQLSETVIVNLK